MSASAALLTYAAERATLHGLGASHCLSRLGKEMAEAVDQNEPIDPSTALTWCQSLRALTHVLFENFNDLELTLGDGKAGGAPAGCQCPHPREPASPAMEA